MGKHHSIEVRARCMDALLAGQRVTEVAKETGVHRSTIQRWRDEMRREGHLDTVKSDRKKQIGELIGEYAVETLKTLVAQQEFFRSKEWLGGQSASELAVLHGVSFDKVVRVFEAAERAGLFGTGTGDGEQPDSESGETDP